MTTVTRLNRAVPREQLGKLIFEAAIAVMRERGYKEATIEAIAARAGVAKGTFFNFYRSKVDVLADYYRGLDVEAAGFRAALDPARPAASLKAYAAAVERLFRAEGALLADLIGLTIADPQLRLLDERSGVSDAAQFADFLERAKRCGTVRDDLDTHQAGLLVVDLWSGAVRHWMSSPHSPLPEIFAAKIELLFRGIGSGAA